MSDLPTGTVTLLFTDIEGSTRLLEQLGAEYEQVLAEHRRLIRSAVATHAGVEVDTQGDAFLCAFARASDAVQAAVQAQRALASTPVRVRMGLHTGEPSRTEEGYVGLDLHRGARVMAAGYGGQVLLSQTTRELLDDEVPMRDLGEHRLKDLGSAVRLYQLGSEEYPPLKTLENRPTNLPAQPTPLVGRERELEEVVSQLRREEIRLLTLTGPGGTGKTRLALQAAAELLEDFPDGVWFVNLAPLTDPTLVPGAIAQTLALRERPGEPIVQTLAAHLRERELLLVLDNFEQVSEAVSVVSELEAAAPALKVLATSRAPLHLSGEYECPVPPLTDEEAVALFAERGRAAKPSFALDGNRPLVAEICKRLDNLPLAVELAAARIKLLPERALLERLQQRLKLLTGGARDRDERQRTLRAAIDWSYNLLSPEEQLLFARLSVFAGGRTLEAIEEICNPEGELDVFEGVASLVDKSLLRQEETEGGEARFVMLETIHEYARERLEESGEADDLRERHAQYYCALAEEAEEARRQSPQSEASWLARLASEHDNLRAALQHASERADPEAELRLVAALGQFWDRLGYYTEGRRLAEAALQRSHQAAPRLRLGALHCAARLAGMQGDLVRAREAAQEGLDLARDLGDAEEIASLLNGLSAVTAEEGDVRNAIALSEEALEHSRRAGVPVVQALVTLNRGYFALFERDFARARALFDESRAAFERVGDRNGVGWALARAGWAALHQEATREASALLRAALTISSESGWRPDIRVCLEGLAAATAGSEPERAARLLGAAAALSDELDESLDPFELAMRERTEADVRAALGDDRFAEEGAAGRAMATDEAVAYALASADVSPDS